MQEENLFAKIIDILLKYTKSKGIEVFYLTLISFVMFRMIDLKYALLFSVLIGLSNLVPYFGPIIGGIPVCIYAVFQSIPMFLWTIVILIALQIIDGFILMPYITKKTVKINELTTIVLVFLGGSAFGIIGILLAVPVYLVGKVIYKHYIKNDIHERG